LRVVGLDIRPPPSFDTNRWTGLSCDVAEEQAWANVMNGIVRDLGAPDILVNAAGVSGLGQQDPASAKAWTETLRTDLIGSWLGMRTVLPHMTARGSGAIVNIGALATQQPFPLAGLGAYTAAKAGIEAVTRSTALEVASAGVAVNCVAPGPIETPMMQTAMPKEARAGYLARIPMGRVGSRNQRCQWGVGLRCQIP
jgi:NAD(P)-dependent dehydrogenase (short-subunit alcohol dehydrogenase family)